MKYCAGIDLHSTNNLLGIVDEHGDKVFGKKLPNDLKEVLRTLRPYRKELVAIAVESTFNWYWLVDGLMESGLDVRLANPGAIKQYDGLKVQDDESDALHLARLLGLGILPMGYIYPKEERPVRDLLRKRLILVRQRTAHILSFKSMVTRNLGSQITANDVKKLTEKDVEEIFDDKHLILSGKVTIASMRFLSEQIEEIEKAVLKVAKLKEEFKNLTTAPGIGKILALTIMLETGDIGRFPQVGNYGSYCRCVVSKRISNGKIKGKGNRKNGNKYLAWAFVEAANFAIRNHPQVKGYYQRKMAKTNRVVALKAVSNKLARACYYVMREGEVFDLKRAFG